MHNTYHSKCITYHRKIEKMSLNTRQKQIADGLQTLINPNVDEIFSGVVKSVNENDATIEVYPDPENEEFYIPVMLRSIVGGLKGIIVIPKIGSEVIYATIEGAGKYCIINASEIDKVLIDVSEFNINTPDMVLTCDKLTIKEGKKGGVINLNTSKMQIGSDSIIINDGKNGSLIIIDKLVERLNTIEISLNDLKTSFGGWTPVASDGGAALKLLLTTPPTGWAVAPLAETTVSDIENPKVKH